MHTEYIKTTHTNSDGMATAPAGTTGSLSTMGMRALLNATDEIEALAVTAAMQLKALADRPGGSRQLPESHLRPHARKTRKETPGGAL